MKRAVIGLVAVGCWTGATTPPPSEIAPAPPRAVEDRYDQRTPRDALRSFVRAVERKRWDIVLRFVPDRYRETMSEQKLRADWEGPRSAELRTLIEQLSANLDAPIAIEGDEARMPYGASAVVRFVREAGVWKLRDLD